MSTTPFPIRGPFIPRFILPAELTQYGLVDANRQPNILSLVDAASSLIDIHCGRTDGTGNGSLVYSTYQERLLMQARNRNLNRVSFKPMVGIPASTISNLQASANAPPNAKGGASANVLMYTNYFWTGCSPNTVQVSNVPGYTLSPFLGASGRYGYSRRSESMIYPDLNYGINPLQIASFFGGPPTWTNIDVTMIDFDVQTGEVWVPAGLYLSQYTELVVVYNSGFDPLHMPPGIKQACAMLIRNFLSRGGGTTGLRSITAAGTANVSFTPDLIDTTIDRMLDPFKTVIAY